MISAFSNNKFLRQEISRIIRTCLTNMENSVWYETRNILIRNNYCIINSIWFDKNMEDIGLPKGRSDNTKWSMLPADFVRLIFVILLLRCLSFQSAGHHLSFWKKKSVASPRPIIKRIRNNRLPNEISAMFDLSNNCDKKAFAPPFLYSYLIDLTSLGSTTNLFFGVFWTF